jgi:hypothetical protein
MGFEVTGQYTFEDSNLDVYKLHDYRQTQFYHGLDREDEFYNTVKNMKRKDSKRVKKWPSPSDFWLSEDPIPFRVCCNEQADWRKFRRWFNKYLRKIDGSDYNYDQLS